jgi:hypothetical protein
VLGPVSVDGVARRSVGPVSVDGVAGWDESAFAVREAGAEGV